MIKTVEAGAGSYPEPEETKEKCYQFDFKASCGGWGFVYAQNQEEAKEKIMDNEYDDIMEYYDYEIEEITRIKEE